jgi:hypothetical protein
VKESKPTEEQVLNTGPDSGPHEVVQEVFDAIEPLMTKGASEEEWDRILRQQLAKLQGAKELLAPPLAHILEKVISETLKENKEPKV